MNIPTFWCSSRPTDVRMTCGTDASAQERRRASSIRYEALECEHSDRFHSNTAAWRWWQRCQRAIGFGQVRLRFLKFRFCGGCSADYKNSSIFHTAIWLLPSTNDVYGIWPRSGEMDLVESRKFNDALTHICCPKYGDDSVICSHFIPIKMIDLGGNRDYVNHVGQQIGVEHIGSTLHFGTNWDDNGYTTATFSKNSKPGYNMGFHRYEMVWTPEYIRFCVDGRKVGVVEVGDGFYSRYPFHGPNPWVNGTKAAPFDQQVNLSAFVYNGPTICPVSNRFNEIRTDLFESQFHILINLAIGGTNGFFPDNEEKPWSNSMHNAMTAFWRGRSQWTPTWNFNSTDAQASSLAVESVRVWAI